MKRLLLVEYDPLVRRALTRLLTRFLAVREATTFDEAKALLGGEPFDVVLSDRELGDGDGVELLRLVAEAWPTATRILMTGRWVPDLSGPSAPHHLLQKPFAPVELLRAIADAVYE
jgi:DNA-binding response OmpR family regulator